MGDLIDNNENHFWGSGWSNPPVFEVGNYKLELLDKVNNINSCIDVLLQTKKGDRIMNPYFGSGLNTFLFRNMDSTLKGEIIEAVKMSLLKNEPRITVTEVDVDFVNEQEGEIAISIVYEVNKTNTRHNHVFPFNIKEGTQLR